MVIIRFLSGNICYFLLVISKIRFVTSKIIYFCELRGNIRYLRKKYSVLQRKYFLPQIKYFVTSGDIFVTYGEILATWEIFIYMCNLGNINRYFRKIFFTSKEWFVITKIRYVTNMIYVRDFRANIFLSQRKDLLPLWKYSLPQGNICFIGRIILYLKERFVTPRKIFATWGNIRDPSGYYVLFEEIFSSSKDKICYLTCLCSWH